MTFVNTSKAITFITTLFALIAFAANSVLCRLALGESAIDAGSFTAIRLLSGAIALLIIFLVLHGRLNRTAVSSNTLKEKSKRQLSGSWYAAFMLFIYAVMFSYAYLSLDTGTGALILFGSVQLTMILTSLIRGERFYVIEWIGLISAFLGFVYLVLPGVSAPSLLGFIMMAIAGMAWAFYTLAGKESLAPLADTTWNFVRTLPIVFFLLVITIKYSELTVYGVVLAMVSGIVASGFGYSVWYFALKGLTSIQAAVVQLLVPVIAALGGAIFASEEVSLRLIVSAIFILGGVMLVVLGRNNIVVRKTKTSNS